MKLTKILSFLFAIAILTVTAASCSKSSVGDEDTLYENTKGIDRYKIKIPENG